MAVQKWHESETCEVQCIDEDGNIVPGAVLTARTEVIEGNDLCVVFSVTVESGRLHFDKAEELWEFLSSVLGKDKR